MKNWLLVLLLGMALVGCPTTDGAVDVPDDDDSAGDDDTTGDDDSTPDVEDCDDGIDNDSDDYVDCDDPDCAGDNACAGDDDDDDTTPADDDDTTGDDDSAGDDDTTGDDDDSTPEPLVVDCVPAWEAGAPAYIGGTWSLCCSTPWVPTLNTKGSTGGLNDQIDSVQSIWFQFGASSAANAALIGQEFENLVLSGTCVFSDMTTGVISPYVHADAPSPSAFNGHWRWMLSPTVGSHLIGPSPASAANWPN